MKKIFEVLFSSKTSLILLIIFTVAIASATFIEDKYDTITAKILIYNAKWFEILLALLVLNFIGSIQKYKLYKKEKLTGLLFHGAFIIILIGAAVTRYIGYEGSMHIRQGESSDFFYSADPYLSVRTPDNNLNYAHKKPLHISAITDNSFKIKIDAQEKGPLIVAYKDYIRNARETYEQGTEGGIDMVELNISVDGHKDVLLIKDGDLKLSHDFPIAFNNNDRVDALKFTSKDEKIFISYPATIKTSKMPEMQIGEIPKDSLVELQPMYLYEPLGSGIAFVLTKIHKNAKVKYVPGDAEGKGASVLLTTVTYNGITQEIPIIGGRGYVDNFQKFSFGNQDLELAYGLKKIKLPFAIRLNEFILDRYAGSSSPSSYASEVTLLDKNLNENHRIFMNNVLDYKGYRFFQSSYDQDEKGTILSVNHDFWGTWISYLGYFLLTIGFILSLFNKNSRYRKLFQEIKATRSLRKTAASILIILFVNIGTSFSQEAQTEHNHDTNTNTVSLEHAKKFGHILVQTYDGRFAPINTLAHDVLHKISRKDKITIPGKGKMEAIQVFLDLPLNAEFWKKQKMIYVREKSVMNILGLEGKHVAFNDLFNQDGSFKLKKVSETAFRKKQSEQNVFDKELIKLNERAEIFLMAYQGNLLKIFPVQNSPNHKWVNWNDKLALVPLTGSIKMLNADLKLKEFNNRSIMGRYLSNVFKATKSGDYSQADKVLGYIDNIQRQSSAASLVPSKTKVSKEIHYNKANIFGKLKNVYALLSVVLLALAFIANLKRKKSKIIDYTLNFFIVLLALAFIYHTYGMGLRWYLSGHAPWSNGYEALILIAWSSILAGFSFVRYSKITLAATALLAFFTLMTASHSSYDPQITNLQPVLKSYWLIIHVATLTISYGFFGLSFFLGVMNLFLYLIKNTKSKLRINLLIKELTGINEVSIIIGLFLATIGTFLGGIWANESWGRYWGWDAKETWALVIIIAYTIILHFRLVPKMKSLYIFNVGSIISFATVLMTFFGVNYYFTKGLHSYASGETPVFPIWAWIVLSILLTLIVAAGIKEKLFKIKKT